MAISTIPHLGEEFSAKITVTEPRNHREIRDLLVSLRGVGAVCVDQGSKKYDYIDAAGFDRCQIFDVTTALEKLASKVEPQTLADAVAAMDILMDLVDWNYSDRRDEKLAKQIRDCIAEHVPAHEWRRS